MKTIVSVTPIRIDTDSRTFKQAASIAHFGYNSIVVEGVQSEVHSACVQFCHDSPAMFLRVALLKARPRPEQTAFAACVVV